MRTLSAPRRPVVRWAVLFYGAMTAATIAAAVGLQRPLPWIAAPEQRHLWIASVALGAVVGLLIVGLSRWMEGRFAWARTLAAGFTRALGSLRGCDVLALAALSAVAEELLFRGLLLDTIGYIGSSVLFGAVHLVPDRTWLPWALLAIGAGFVFGALALVTGSVLAPVVAHFVVNLLNLRALSLRPPEPPDGRPDL